jgi:hypothetical protein
MLHGRVSTRQGAPAPEHHVRWAAVVIGRLYPFSIFLGLVAGSIAGILLGLIGGIIAAASGVDLLSPATFARVDIAAFVVAVSIVTSVLTGYIAARSSPGEELVNAIAAGSILLVVALCSGSEPLLASLPSWARFSSAMASLPAAVVGGLFLRGLGSAA